MPGSETNPQTPHRRRLRYAGKNPRRFEEKYKEHQPERFQETIQKVLAAGKTPAGMHRSIMVGEVLELLQPAPGKVAVDATLGYGGHAQALLERLIPGGRLIGLDADPLELPKTELRLRGLGFGPDVFKVFRSNFAGLPQVLAGEELSGVDLILADLGVSSMQLDDPSRGFSTKNQGPLDMRMNPKRGYPASALLERIKPEALSELLRENADEPRAELLAQRLSGQKFSSTQELSGAIRSVGGVSNEEMQLTVRRVFQALRIAVNDEFSALESFLRILPSCLNEKGRVAILTFHSGEDARVKKAFKEGRVRGEYAEISDEVLRPSLEERQANPRSTSAKLRWARKS